MRLSTYHCESANQVEKSSVDGTEGELLALIVISFVVLTALAFVAEIPIEGWSAVSGRAAWCYAIIQDGHAGVYLPQRLLIGGLSPITSRVRGSIAEDSY